MDATYVRNYVLIWSITEKFKPKLFLESPREVHSLAFSSISGNFVVGGLINGQVVVWDISKKIKDLDSSMCASECSLKNEKQANYSCAIRTHLSWMLEKDSEAFIAPSFVSSLRFCHKACVTGVEWVSPYLKFTETGNIESLKGQEKSEQFLTCSEDGCVNFWDLHASKLSLSNHSCSKPGSVPSLAHEKHMKRTFMKPFFQILTQHPEGIDLEKDSDHLLGSVPVSTLAVNYSPAPSRREKSRKLTKKITFAKVDDVIKEKNDKRYKELLFTKHGSSKFFEVDGGDLKSGVLLGTLDGVVAKLAWNEYDSDSEQTLGPQVGSFSFWGDVHDGPVISLVRSPFISDLILSVGGKVFAIWKEDMKDTPLYRKKSSTLMTSGSWSIYKPSIFYITYMDGRMDVWDLLELSDGPIFSQNISGKILTGVYPSFLPSKNILGIADFNGSFRMFHVPIQHMNSDNFDVEKLHCIIKREMHRKNSFIQWQRNWEIINAEMLKSKKDAIELEAKKGEEAERERNRKLKELKKKREKEQEERKLRQEEVRAKTFTWKQDAEHKWNKKQEKYLIKTLLKNKRLDQEELQIKQMLHTTFLEEEKTKKRKQRDMISQKKPMYDSTVRSRFPEVSEAQEKTISRFLTNIHHDAGHPVITKSYSDVEREMLTYIKNHPYTNTFNWTSFMTEGQKRRQIIQSGARKTYFSK